MSNKLSIYLLIFLACITLVAADQSFNVIEDNLQLSLAPDRETIIPLQIMNTGSEDIILEFDISQLDLRDREDDQIEISFNPSQPILVAGENATVNMHLRPERTISFESFGGPLNVHVLNNTGVQDIVNINIEVQPDVCDFGVVGSDLEVDIEEPGSNDDFKPGEEITLEVRVANNGQNSIRVQTEAFLFSKSRNMQDAASETKTLDEDDDFTFTMSMIIPADPEEIDEDEELRLVVKAFDDENERRNCAIDMININVQLEDEAVAVDAKESRISPEVAACGDTVKGYVKVRNIGSEDNDRVSISLSNRELGINLKSDTFSLENFDDERNSLATRQFDVRIPTTAQEKSYPFTARVDFKGGSEEIILPFQVASCLGARRDEGIIDAVLIRPLEEHIVVNQGTITSVPVQITNVRNERVTYTITLTNIGEIGQADTKTIVVNPGQITTTFLELNIKPDAQPDLYSGSIVVKQAGNTVGSQTLVIEVKEASPQNATASTFQSVPLVVWIVLVILAVGACILAIMASMKYFKRQRV